MAANHGEDTFGSHGEEGSEGDDAPLANTTTINAQIPPGIRHLVVSLNESQGRLSWLSQRASTFRLSADKAWLDMEILGLRSGQSITNGTMHDLLEHECRDFLPTPDELEMQFEQEYPNLAQVIQAQVVQQEPLEDETEEQRSARFAQEESDRRKQLAADTRHAERQELQDVDDELDGVQKTYDAQLYTIQARYGGQLNRDQRLKNDQGYFLDVQRLSRLQCQIMEAYSEVASEARRLKAIALSDDQTSRFCGSSIAPGGSRLPSESSFLGPEERRYILEDWHDKIVGNGCERPKTPPNSKRDRDPEYWQDTWEAPVVRLNEGTIYASQGHRKRSLLAKWDATPAADGRLHDVQGLPDWARYRVGKEGDDRDPFRDILVGLEKRVSSRVEAASWRVVRDRVNSIASIPVAAAKNIVTEIGTIRNGVLPGVLPTQDGGSSQEGEGRRTTEVATQAEFQGLQGLAAGARVTRKMASVGILTLWTTQVKKKARKPALRRLGARDGVAVVDRGGDEAGNVYVEEVVSKDDSIADDEAPEVTPAAPDRAGPQQPEIDWNRPVKTRKRARGVLDEWEPPKKGKWSRF